MIVVDASAMADALMDDGPVGRAARAALQDDPHWAAPAHLLVEVVSVVRGRVLGGKLSTRRSTATVRALKELSIDWVDAVDLVDRIWQLRGNLTPYDAAYVAAAERLGCPLVTGDARLGRIPGPRCAIHVLAPAGG